MKFAIFVITFAFAIAANLTSAQATPSLRSCFSEKSAEFFAHEMEGIAQEKRTPVLLMNDRDQVVGVISVTAERAAKYPFKTITVDVEKVSLCGTFEVTDFYYTDGPSANLVEWTAAKTGAVYVTQGEGLLVLNAKVGAIESYATRIDVEFKVYDVFTEIESYTPEDRKSPDFIDDWGLPKGAGKFHFYIPANWKLVP